jgi:hypothetical protein
VLEICKRAGTLSDPDRYAYTTGDRGTVALANRNGLTSAGGDVATFIVTEEIVDRDGDFVRVDGLDLSEWEAAGAPWFFSHQEKYPYPIGTAIGPDGKLAAWRSGPRLLAKCFFDMDDQVARFVADKVSKRLMRSASLAFVPIQVEPRSESLKARTHSEPRPKGYDFLSASVTEVSIVGVGANPRALLQMAATKGCPAVLCKALRECAADRRWYPRVLSPAVAREWERLKPALERYIRKCQMGEPVATGRIVSPRVERAYLELRAVADRYVKQFANQGDVEIGHQQPGARTGNRLDGEETRECKRCKGRGKLATGVCPVCKGSGLEPGQEEYMECPRCQGEGETRPGLLCQLCDGEGQIPDPSSKSAGDPAVDEAVAHHQEIMDRYGDNPPDEEEFFERYRRRPG